MIFARVSLREIGPPYGLSLDFTALAPLPLGTLYWTAELESFSRRTVVSRNCLEHSLGPLHHHKASLMTFERGIRRGPCYPGVGVGMEWLV